MEKSKKYHFANRIPLFAQLIALMFFLILVLVISVFGSIHKNAQILIQDQMQESSQKLIRVELTNLDEYIDSIMNFCVQPCYDTTFYNCIEAKHPLSQQQFTAMKDSMKKYYYSMTNITDYQMYLLNQNTVLYRDSSTGQFTQRQLDELSTYDMLNDYLHSGNAYGIYDTDTEDTFLSFYHSIIQIDNRKPQAVISVTVDTQFIQTLLENHKDNDEFICILNSQNQLLYSSNHDYIATTDDLSTIFVRPDRIQSTVTFNGKKFCTQIESSKNYGLKILSCLPVTYFNTVTTSLLRSSLILSVTLCLASCLMVFVLIRLTTSPLTTFSRRLDQVAAGDYKSKLEMGGSSEIAQLCDSFNSMIKHIGELDQKKSIDELKQKSSTMRILNLNINPHVYYSVIQDIFIEASNCNEPKLMRMAQSISNIMNYLNNNIDFSTIQDEIYSLSNFLYLEEVHIDQTIRIDYQIPGSIYDLHVPKLTFQILTAPLIQYGSWSKNQPLNVRISATEHDGSLYLIFEGIDCVVSDEFIQQYQQNLPKIQTERSYINGSPLLNLYARLTLLYNNDFNLDFDVQNHHCRSIKLIIPTISQSLTQLD